MNFNSKKISLIFLVITALVFSRAMFALFNDPEGPNLLIVTVLAAIVFVASWVTYAYNPSTREDSPKRLLLPIFIQLLIVTSLYLLG